MEFGSSLEEILSRLPTWFERLTRQLDASTVTPDLVKDEKISGPAVLYIPANDGVAAKCYEQCTDVSVRQLPATVDDNWLRQCDHGLLSLHLRPTDGSAVFKGSRYVVPGGRFNEFYGWDTYFIALGILALGGMRFFSPFTLDSNPLVTKQSIELTVEMIDNQCYEIEYFGKVLNANRTYYLRRSQPPFLSSMVREIVGSSKQEWGARKTMFAEFLSDEWLQKCILLIAKEYTSIWMGPGRLDPETGLSVYGNDYDGGIPVIPPECEEGHFEPLFQMIKDRFPSCRNKTRGELVEGYENQTLPEDVYDYMVCELQHDIAMRESGHDTTNRLVGRCHHLATVDLNSLLFKVEDDLELFYSILGDSSEAKAWKERKEARRKSILRHMYCPNSSQFYDYDTKQKSRTSFAAVVTLMPIWAGVVTDASRIDLVISTALTRFEQSGGMVCTTEESRGVVSRDHPQRQWDYPYGWAPLQIITWKALYMAGRTDDVVRVAKKWLRMIVQCYESSEGYIAEKYDVVSATHLVPSPTEYGNVMSKYSGFGWTNASILLANEICACASTETCNK